MPDEGNYMDNEKCPKLAIIVPCYNEEEILRESAKILYNTIINLVKSGTIHSDSLICFVNDGSTDHTWDIIVDLNKINNNIKGIKLSRNCGHQKAIMAGLLELKNICDCLITIDADLQDDINAIYEMMVEYNKGNEIVYGIRKQRVSDSFFKRITAEGFYKFMQLMGVKIIFNHADYRLMSRRVVDHLSNFREVNLFLRGIVTLLGFRSSVVYYDRLERFGGTTKFTVRKMLEFAFDGITSFSIVPLRIITFLGFIFFGLSILMSLYILYATFHGITVKGWPSIVLPVWFIGGIQMIGIGLLGEYIGKIYNEVKARPKYIIESEIGL
jgi:glycosyltransferase involved in cell wall biosynthesis